MPLFAARRTVLSAAAAAAFLVLTGCSKSDDAKSSASSASASSADTLEKPTLVVGMELAYPPFEGKDEQGNPAGVSVDFMKDFAKSAGKEIKTETGVVLSWKYLCWVREHPVKSICKETNILYGTQDEMIPYKIVKKFSEENNCRLNFVENGQHWLHTDREVAAMRKWEQTVLEESRSIIPNK